MGLVHLFTRQPHFFQTLALGLDHGAGRVGDELLVRQFLFEALGFLVQLGDFVLPIAAVIDVAGEQARLEKEIAKLDQEAQRFEKKLANEKFVANAPGAVVETERERLEEVRLAREKMNEAHQRLTAAF